MSAADEARAWLGALGTAPDIQVHDFDLASRRAVLVRLDADTLRAAAFHDDRALTPATPGLVVPLDAVLEAALAIEPQPFDALFHVGHCGSTLVSRLVAGLPGNLPRREPRWWLGVGATRRRLGQDLTPRAWDALWTAGRRALGRRFVADERVLLKSTSVAANLALPLLAEEPAARAVLLVTDLESWLARLLADPERRAHAEHNLGLWLADLGALLRDEAPRARDLAPVERAVINWVAPMLHFEAVLRTHPARAKLLRAADVLAMPRVALAALSSHLSLGASATDIARVLSGPDLGRDAKQPTQAFDAVARDAVLRAARATHAAELRAGLDFALRFAADSPLVVAHLRG